jgi:Ran GTPase-activating protein (RanGAP) involved in mRNA processing and transport
LEELILSNNRLGDIGFAAVLEALSSNASITSLRVANNNIRKLDLIKEMGLIAIQKLELLDLSGNDVESEGIKILEPYLGSLTTLIILDCGISSGAVETLMKVLKCGCLCELDIGSSSSKQALVSALNQNRKAFEEKQMLSFLFTFSPIVKEKYLLKLILNLKGKLSFEAQKHASGCLPQDFALRNTT